VRAKKHLGQHFLRDRQVIDNILDAITKHCPLDTPIAEVGPGQGILTYTLAEKYLNFKAIEFDRDMIAVLVQQLDPQLLINDNFLAVDLKTLFDNQAFNLVGNFPYNISSQIIFKMLENRQLIPRMVGMFQKEVADRICSGPGSKTYGIISLRAQAYYTVEKLFDIGPEAFDPPPKVDSSVIVLTRKEHKDLPCDEKVFNAIIKASFQQRRKKLRNTLKAFVLNTEAEIFQLRPEQLSVEDFINIAQLIQKQKE